MENRVNQAKLLEKRALQDYLNLCHAAEEKGSLTLIDGNEANHLPSPERKTTMVSPRVTSGARSALKSLELSHHLFALSPDATNHENAGAGATGSLFPSKELKINIGKLKVIDKPSEDTKKLNELQLQCDQLKQSESEAKRQLEQMSHMFNALQLEYITVKESSMKESSEITSAYEITIQALQGNSKQMESRLNELTKELLSSKNELRTLQNTSKMDKIGMFESYRCEISRLEELVEQSNHLMTRQEELLRTQTIKMNELDEKNKENKRTINALESVVSQRDVIIKNREETLSVREEAIIKLEQQVMALDKSIMDSQNTIQNMAMKLEESNSQLRILERALDSEKSFRRKEEEMRICAISRYESMIENLRKEFESVQKQHDINLIAKMEFYENQKQELIKIQTEKSNLMSETIANNNQELNQLRNQLTTVISDKSAVEEALRLMRQHTEESSIHIANYFEKTSEMLLAKLRSPEDDALAKEISTNLEQVREQLEAELAAVAVIREEELHNDILCQRDIQIKKLKDELNIEQIKSKEVIDNLQLQLVEKDDIIRCLENEVILLRSHYATFDNEIALSSDRDESTKESKDNSSAVVSLALARTPPSNRDKLSSRRAIAKRANILSGLPGHSVQVNECRTIENMMLTIL